MPATPAFDRFPVECAQFLVELACNNEREWFLEHKAEYDAFVMTPARAFVTALGARLKAFAPGVHADPRVNGSIFRQNRDTRFSRDPTPYKTHLGLWLWEGERDRMECSGFYFHVEPPRVYLGTGLHAFPKEHLATYRASVAHPVLGPALARAAADVRAAGPYAVEGEHYKRVPPGFDAAPEAAPFLRFSGLWAGIELPVATIFEDGLLDVCAAHFRNMAPLHRWLLEMTRRVPG